jgi:HAE1 family hydrophobic/amphiphilic exporter-1
MRGFIAATVVRPVTTAMVTVAVLLFGFVALTRLPVELLPDLSYPTITVQTDLLDAAPSEIEELVTRPVEELVGAVPGVIRVESTSREGRSEVVLDFAWGTQVDSAMADVREKLDRVRLPPTAERPVVLRYDPAQEPILRLAVPRVDGERMAELRTLVERRVKRELEKLPGVAAAQLFGGDLDEIRVELDPARLDALAVDPQEVVDALARDNVNRPGGALTERDSRYLIRTVHEARTPEDVAAIVVRSQGMATLRIRDLGRVLRAPIEREELVLVGEREAVELAIYREGDANTVAVANAVLQALPDFDLGRSEAGRREVLVLSNQATFIESAVAEVRDNLLVGSGLAIAVLLFFLRDLRATVVIALAIPLSLLATFIPLQALGVSLNLMSLGGLALGVGMLVDNSIVVLEAIARVREQEPERGSRYAAIRGASEVAGSVIASTLTTVAVFFPIAFLEGVSGQLVRDLSLAVSLSILTSMAASLTLVPVLQGLGDATARRPDERDSPGPLPAAWLVVPFALVLRLLRGVVAVIARLLAAIAWPATRAWDALEQLYPPLLRVALRARAVVLLAAAGVCVAAWGVAQAAERTLIPAMSQGEFFVQLSLPQGTSLERSTAVARALAAAIADDPLVAATYTRVGSVTQADAASGSLLGTHLAQVNVRLAPSVGRSAEREEARLFAAMTAANPAPEAAARLGHPALFSFAAPIEVRVFADDASRSAAHVERLLPALREVPGLVDVTPDDLSGRPEVRVRFDRERLGRVGLDATRAASAVQRAIQGEVATTVHALDQQLDVRVQLPRVNRSDVRDVARIQVGVVEGVPVRLSAVAELEPALGPAEIRRIDGQRGMRVQARVDSPDLGAVAARVDAILSAHAGDDPRVRAELAGQASELDASNRSLVFTALLSVFLVYVVMASSFESLHHPFLILFTIPLAVAGAVLGVAAASLPLSAMVGIGVIILAGIVVNNAIVLIDAVNLQRGRGSGVHEALVHAGALRLRPILMTTLTTVLGLLPMALGLGDGAALRQPLAVAVIGGLGLSTALTLLVIPCAYSLVPGRRSDAWREPEAPP